MRILNRDDIYIKYVQTMQLSTCVVCLISSATYCLTVTLHSGAIVPDVGV